MKKLEYSIAFLIFWLTFLFNIERLAGSVDIRSYTYIFVAFVAVVTVILPKLSRGSFLLLLMIPTLIFLVFKTFFEAGGWRDNLLIGNALTLTVTQISAIIITGLLARQISTRLVDFNEVITTLTFGRIGSLPPSFAVEQTVMYNEVQRARRYERPLAVVAIKMDKATLSTVLPKVVEEVQQIMMNEYARSRMVRLLDDNLLDFDTIVRYDDNLILLLPETTVEDVAVVVNKISTAAKDEMNVKLQTGIATLPDDGRTFELLIETALQNVDQLVEDDDPPLGQSQQYTVSQKM